MTASDLIAAIGRSKVQQLLGLSESSLSTAIGENKFPARWYQGLSELAEAAGVDCPMELFAWREAAA